MAKLKKVQCSNCKKTFIRPSGRFNEAIKFGWNQFCSDKCQFSYKTTAKKFACENCGKKFLRALSNISKHNYCSQSCSAIINNKNRPERNAKTISCENCGKEFKRWIVGNKKYCSRNCRNVAENYTKEELLEIIKIAVKKLKRVPSKRELIKIDKACVKFFGSWNNAISTAGFTPNRSHNDRMYKRSICKSNDGHLCDSVSELLIDNWLYKNRIQHERDAFYPTTNHKADWKILNNNKEYFVEYFGLANDSPRYDRSIKEKLTICNNHKINLIEIYPKDLYPKINLENNLKIKFEKYL